MYPLSLPGKFNTLLEGRQLYSIYFQISQLRYIIIAYKIAIIDSICVGARIT